jgi:protein TonB
MKRTRVDPAGLLVSVGVHAVVIAALLMQHPVRQRLAEVAPLVVRLIAPEAPQPIAPAPPRTPPRLITPTPPRLELPQIVLAPTEPVRQTPPAPAPTPAPTAISAPAAAQSLGEPQAISIAVTPPLYNADYLDNPTPAYPSTSRRAGEQGKVILRVLVSPAGHADEVQLRTSSGFTRLDEAARATVQRWKFVPAKRGSEPIAAWVLIPISFRLER